MHCLLADNFLNQILWYTSETPFDDIKWREERMFKKTTKESKI
jgi:hypothetical protein